MEKKINKIYSLQQKVDKYKEELTEYLKPYIDFEFSLHYEYNNWAILCDELTLSVSILNVLEHIEKGTKLTEEFVSKYSRG